MSKFGQRFWNVVRTPFKKLNLSEGDPNVFKGKIVMAQKEFDAPFEEVVVNDVRGCVALGEMTEAERARLVKSFQINGTHYCSIQSFYWQILEGRLPTPEEIEEFELATQITKIKEIK